MPRAPLTNINIFVSRRKRMILHFTASGMRRYSNALTRESLQVWWFETGRAWRLEAPNSRNFAA